MLKTIRKPGKAVNATLLAQGTKNLRLWQQCVGEIQEQHGDRSMAVRCGTQAYTDARRLQDGAKTAKDGPKMA